MVQNNEIMPQFSFHSIPTTHFNFTIWFDACNANISMLSSVVLTQNSNHPSFI